MLADEQEIIFKQWFCEYKAIVFKVARAYADKPNDQDDLFQEILLQLWKSVSRFGGKAKTSTWIYRVALNTALVWKRTEIRKRRKHRKLITDFERACEIQHSSHNPMANNEILDRLYTAIRQLSKTDSSIVLMYLDGLAYDQMADVLGISINNIGVRLNRAKKKLAQLLKGLVDDF